MHQSMHATSVFLFGFCACSFRKRQKEQKRNMNMRCSQQRIIHKTTASYDIGKQQKATHYCQRAFSECVHSSLVSIRHWMISEPQQITSLIEQRNFIKSTFSIAVLLLSLAAFLPDRICISTHTPRAHICLGLVYKS
jgi:hypothetical protein